MIQSSNELNGNNKQVKNSKNQNGMLIDTAMERNESRRKMEEFEMETKRYDHICQTVYEKIRQRIAKMEQEIDELYNTGKTDSQLEEIRKRKRRNNDKLLLRKVSKAEAIEDLNEIRGIKNTLYVNVENGTLTIDDLKIKKRDNVKVEMHGETFKGSVISITAKTAMIKSKNNKKYGIPIQSIKKEDVKIIKTNK